MLSVSSLTVASSIVSDGFDTTGATNGRRVVVVVVV